MLSLSYLLTAIIGLRSVQSFTKPRTLRRSIICQQAQRRDLNPSENATKNDLWESMSSDEQLLLSIAKFGEEESLTMPFLSAEKPASFHLSRAQAVHRFLNIPVVEVTLGALVFISSILVAVDTITSLDVHVLQQLTNIEDTIANLFFVEFFLRWYSNADTKQPYLTRPLVLVDILVVVLPVTLHFLHNIPSISLAQLLPPWLVGQSGLVNLRLLRILRLQRVLSDLDTFARFQIALGLPVQPNVQNYQLQLARVVLSLFTLLSVSTGLIYTAEHNVNPQIPDYFTALYFGLTTLTTVGFGDITPMTAEGKLVVSGSILAGVAIIPAQAASLVEALLDYEKQRNRPMTRRQQQEQSDNGGSPRDGMLDTRNPCPTCGATYHWSDATFCWSCGNEL